MRPAPEPVASARRGSGPGWIFAYIAIEFACHFALLVKELAPARVFFRSTTFGASLLFLLVVPGSSRGSHPARIMALLAMTVLTLSAFNPDGGAPLAVIAHWAMCLSVVAPLFWVARLDVAENTLERLLLVLWVYHTISSVFGLLQVYYPGQFQPTLTTFISEKAAMTIRLASGEIVVRPMGLSDVPGGAAGSGLSATLIGIGVVLTRPFAGARLLGLLSMVTGMACIYLSQVRAVLVMLGICFVVLAGLFALSGRIPRLAWSLLIGAAAVIVGFELALDLGGSTVTNRLDSLVQSDPGTVYRSNRGFMLEYAFNTLLPEYPLGAGLGHWGMMNLYFGSREDRIHAEVQWVGWILDGGIPLVLAYLGAILAAIFHAVRASLRQSEHGREGWAVVIAAYNVGVLALCFTFAPFMSAGGLEFWLLNGVLIQVGMVSASGPPPLGRRA